MQFFQVIEQWGFDGLNLVLLMVAIKISADNRSRLNYVEGLLDGKRQDQSASGA